MKLLHGTLLAALAGSAVVATTETLNTIVVLQPGTSVDQLVASGLLAESEITSKFDIGDAGRFAGFVTKSTPRELQQLQQSSLVRFIEQDKIYRALGESQPCGPNDLCSWGLDRISQDDLPLSGEYTHDPEGGRNVDVYIVDTGINTKHDDFNGRAKFGASFPSDARHHDTDCQGHGTHVAGTVGGTHFGVAKAATLIGVKVMGCLGFGSTSDIVQGIDWVTRQHTRSGKAFSVLNMSLGGSQSDVLDAAVDASSAAGVVNVVAAGNSRGDACHLSPAGAETAFTVGSTSKKDKISYFSERGPCVDIQAPGSSITSASNKPYKNGATPEGQKTQSGTSMAAPHVAGAVAVKLSQQCSHDMVSCRFQSVDEIVASVVADAVEDKLSNVPSDTVNKLLYVRASAN
ncbi:MAG: hypothetical protein MHM6MM_006107 [Cercozoa sp. M6MM]